MKGKKTNNSEYFISRELSWLEFNKRVLEEAQDNTNPLLERLKFLSIASSNLDEFFMIRVGSLNDQINVGFNKPDPSGMTPKENVKEIYKRVSSMIQDQYNCLTYSLLPALKSEGFNFIDSSSLNPIQLNSLNEYFENQIYPVLTTMAVDESRPFPLISNRSLNLAVLLKGEEKDKHLFATVQVPSVLPRFIEVHTTSTEMNYILLEDIIKMNTSTLFKGYKIIAVNAYRITRNADLSINEDEADDLLLEIKKSLKMRKWGTAVRLEVESRCDERILTILKDALELDPLSIYRIKGPIDVTFLFKFTSQHNRPDLRDIVYPLIYPPAFSQYHDVFSAIRDKDILVHQPYEDFECVIDFINQAANDPDVLAIKQTLYRISNASPIIKALHKAVENGKQVTVLFEIKARFDEENNIQWAKKLEEVGCHVTYGLIGLKTHCKVTLVVRREDDGIRRYVHLSTGNYNEITAKLYTDIGLFTSDKHISSDASALFNQLTGYSDHSNWYILNVAPFGLRKKITEFIKNEIKLSTPEEPGRIIIKVNSLVDTEIIKLLYKASCRGVKISLIIRGMCCLRPGIQGVSENIRVTSIVDRHLEHSRVFYFQNGGREDIYLSSADLMERNLDRRVELMFPIQDEDLKKRQKSILDIYLNDNVKARELKADGRYVRINRRGKKPIHSQVYLHENYI
ncbi:MAG: RNA degradosome polyphosphate kinase [Ruminiclostridium sp.]